jgi:sphinganine-1-phosphate aldolase
MLQCVNWFRITFIFVVCACVFVALDLPACEHLRRPVSSTLTTLQCWNWPSCLRLTGLQSSIRNIIFALFVLRWTRRLFWQLRGRGLVGSAVELYINIRRILYGYFLRAPGVRGQVRKQVDEALSKMESKLVSANLTRHTTLPEQGLSFEEVNKEVDELLNLDHVRWEDGRVSGAVYHGERELLKLQTDVYGKFTVSNPIHPDVFPGVRKMEAEVVAMVLSLFNAPPGSAGATSSGGTESILMACLSARQWGYAEKGIKEPEM